MRTLVFGAKGQLGRELLARFREEGDVAGVDLPEVDIADAQVVRAACESLRPDWVINAAAFTDVEGAEDDPESAFRVNDLGALHVAAAAAALAIPIVYYSTDYVFDGARQTPYAPDDAAAPLSVYGRSKLAGEDATRQANPRHFIIRTAWLYGPGGNNFVEKMIRTASQRASLKVVDEEIGSPTHTQDLAEATARLLHTPAYGTYHAVNSGACSRYVFTCAILQLAGIATPVEPCRAAEFPMKARRPLYSALSSAKLEAQTGYVMRPWEDALKAYMERRRVHA